MHHANKRIERDPYLSGTIDNLIEVDEDAIPLAQRDDADDGDGGGVDEHLRDDEGLEEEIDDFGQAHPLDVDDLDD